MTPAQAIARALEDAHPLALAIARTVNPLGIEPTPALITARTPYTLR